MHKSKEMFFDHQMTAAADAARTSRQDHIERIEYLRGQGRRISFVDQQIKLHNKAEDILMVIKKCKRKLDSFKRQLASWTPDLSLYSKQELEYKVSWQRFVLCRLTDYYTKLVQKIIEPVMKEMDIEHLFTEKKPAPCTTTKI